MSVRSPEPEALAAENALLRRRIAELEAERTAALPSKSEGEEALREGEERYRALFDRSLDCVFLLDLSGRFLDMNQTMLDLLGYQPAEIPTLTMEQILSADQIQLAQERIRAILATGFQKTPAEYQVRGKDGRILFVETQSALMLRHGKPYAVQVVGRDITERKRAEQALVESEARFRAIVNLAPDGIFIASVDGRVLEANDAAASQLGVTRAQLLEMSLKDFVAPRYAERIARLREETEPPAFRESTHLRPDGTEVPVELFVRRISFRGQPAMLGVARDVAARKRAEAEREKLQAQLIQAQKMESVGRLAGGVAHDFNNMLTAILGNTEMVLAAMPPESSERQTLEEIRRCAQRSAELTEQLLAFARKQIIAPKVLDLNIAVDGLLKMMRRLIGEDIDLAWRPGSDLGSVNMDPSQVDQILANLCVNARDAIGDRAGKVTIETANIVLDDAYVADHPEARAGEWVRLAVSDNGCGMTPDVKARLFEPFFTTKEPGQGTGLGLATVYGIVKQNHGFINVYSEPQRGSVLSIYFPRHHATSVSSAREAATATPRRGQETILLVEDEPSILRIIQRLLEKLGYEVLVARTPGEAIQLASERRGAIHLLMTDVVMPEMNGRVLAQKLVGQYPNLKRLFMSGYTANVIAHHGVLDPGVSFLQKPFSVQALADKVREALEDKS